MESSKLKDLVQGKIYKCRLSGKSILITSKTKDGDSSDYLGNEIFRVEGMYYNETTGNYDFISVWDDMLRNY